MRRRSIVGPLLLIALGALLLIHNIYPELAIGDYLSKYWPYLLIGWGVLRLAEIITWSSSGKPLPARGVSGGEWILIVFLIMIGSGMHAVQNGPRQFSLEIPWGDVDIFHERHDYPVTTEHAASKSPQVTLEDFRGDITVKGVEEAAVKLSGNMSISALDKDAADQAKASSSFEITGDDQNLTVRLKDGGQKRATRIAGNLEITVPKGASIRATRRSGDIRITGVDGSVNVDGRGSNVSLEDIAGPVTVDGVFTGSIRAQNIAKQMNFKGRNTQFTVEKVPGELTVDSGDVNASDVVGPMTITSRSADMRLTGFTNALDVTLQRGDLHVEPGKLPLAPMHLRSKSGDIQVILPEGAQFSVDASTDSGDISNSFGGGLKVDERGRRQSLKGSVGSGAAIEIQTNRGDISISKGSPISTPTSVGDSTKKGALTKIEQ